ncbi:MAG TPA: SDR family oxidoreductase, partial [Gammaproteobacteria bacterium]|nr:SDR family oxidoreductase [Gammaproteobacteria bacterium]
MKKTCLVTGANSGIGKEISLALAKAGAHVIMVCRNEEKGRAAQAEIKALSSSQAVDLLIADLSSQSSIKSLAKTINERYAALHVLINNAGLVLAKKTLSEDGIEMTLATNHLGPFLLTTLLLDLMKKHHSRIINISSAIHKWTKIDLNDLQFEKRKYRFMRAYAQSKLLMNITTFELARQLAGTNITVNCIHPGVVRTNLGSSNAKNLAVKFLDKAIKLFFTSPKRAAQFPFCLAMSSEMDHITGQYFVKGKPAKA